MAYKKKFDKTDDPVRNPYDLKTDDGEIVNVNTAPPQRTLTIHGHKIRVKDIPITVATLDNGEIIRGVAFAPGDLIYTTDKDSGALVSARVIKVEN